MAEKKTDIRSFFSKPAAKPTAVGAATASPVAAPSAAKQLPSTAAAAPKEAPKEAPKSTPVKRAAEAEVVDLVDSDEEGGGAAAAPSKRARADTGPSPAFTGKRARSPTTCEKPKKPATKKAASTPKPSYPRPPVRDPVELNYTMCPAGNAWNGVPHSETPISDCLRPEQLPRGPDDCLTGETFVLTGQLPHLTRDDTESLIKRHGGRITQAVSSKTTYLVVGLESGHSKVGKAREVGTKLVDEEGLLAMIALCGSQTQANLPPPAAAIAPQETSRPAVAGPSVAVAGPPVRRSLTAPGDQLWVEKHKPTCVAQLVGNGKLVADLRAWLAQWHSLNLTPQPGVKAKDAPKKAVLISGPPGIGKTSAAKIICAALGFDVMEINASDARGKAESDVKSGLNGKSANMVKEMVTNSSVNFGSGPSKRQVLIMDEVDGMSGGDRGGVQDLMNSIKISKVPIICICNDAWCTKLRSLKNYCLELPFHRPTKQQIRGRMLGIAAQEGLQVNDTAMEALIENCNSDIRLVLNTLQMRRLNSDSLRFDDVKTTATKDLELGAFNAADKLMQPERSLPLNDRMNLVFQDSDIIPLFIQENYINMRPCAAHSDLSRMELLADASSCISDGDVLNTCIRSKQRWTLMPYAVVLGSVQPASIMRGRREALGIFPGEKNFNRFPAWLGKNSSAGKQRRLLGELHSHTQVSGICFANRSSIREEYLPTLRLALTAPMFGVSVGGAEKEGIAVVMAIMNDYSLTRDDWEALLELTRIKAEGVADQRLRDPASLIPTAVKAAFTRACNDKTRDIKSGLMLPEFKKGRAKKKSVDVDEDVDEHDADADEEEEEPEAKERNPKQLAALAKRGISLNLKDGGLLAGAASGAKGKGKAAPKPKAKAGAPKKK